MRHYNIGCLKTCPDHFTDLFYQALAKLTRGNSISFLFFGEDGTVVAKIRAFCYNPEFDTCENEKWLQIQ